MCLHCCVYAFHVFLCLFRFFFCCFFFSSRRRHTRCLSDWSSDVCSSDLTPSSRRGCPAMAGCSMTRVAARAGASTATPTKRSEERRVGKECRSRWATYDEKKKTERVR